MSDSLDRGEVLRLLDRLGSDQDEVVLEAARELHAQVMTAGIDWDELLAPDRAAETADDGGPVAASTDDESVGDEDGRTLALIDKLLAGSDRSAALREELEEYKTDIANGEFEARDHAYVRALYARLTT